MSASSLPTHTQICEQGWRALNKQFFDVYPREDKLMRQILANLDGQSSWKIIKDKIKYIVEQYEKATAFVRKPEQAYEDVPRFADLRNDRVILKLIGELSVAIQNDEISGKLRATVRDNLQHLLENFQVIRTIGNMLASILYQESIQPNPGRSGGWGRLIFGSLPAFPKSDITKKAIKLVSATAATRKDLVWLYSTQYETFYNTVLKEGLKVPNSHYLLQMDYAIHVPLPRNATLDIIVMEKGDNDLIDIADNLEGGRRAGRIHFSSLELFIEPLLTALHAIDFLHKHNLAYLDLKPDQIIAFKSALTKGFRLNFKLADFGSLVPLREAFPTYTSLSHNYAPELLSTVSPDSPNKNGMVSPDESADAFALGALMLNMLRFQHKSVLEKVEVEHPTLSTHDQIVRYIQKVHDHLKKDDSLPHLNAICKPTETRMWKDAIMSLLQFDPKMRDIGPLFMLLQEYRNNKPLEGLHVTYPDCVLSHARKPTV